VVELRLPKGTRSEQRGRRFGVIVQSDALLPRSVVLVAPTSTVAREATVRPIIEVLGDRTKVLVEQVSALNVSRLGAKIMTLHGEPLWAIDDALELVFGLN
jgi:mRNA interferase MazF